MTKHYTTHKEAARELVHARLAHFNQHYNLTYKRVAIRNQRRCWGSCTSLGNLNFSYRLLFLPPELADYVIVHELCHLKELNHSPNFWALVSETMPEYKIHRKTLRQYDHVPVRTLAGV
ncbi:MAG: M48 family metallopeptidase [Candidatus Paceibacterota bacterium]